MRKNLFSWIAIISIWGAMAAVFYIALTRSMPIYCLYILIFSSFIIPTYEIYAIIHNNKGNDYLYELPMKGRHRLPILRRCIRSAFTYLLGILCVIMLLRITQ